MGLFDNVKDSIKGSDSQNNGGGFDSGEFDNSFTSDNSGSEMDSDPLGSPQEDGLQNNGNSPRNSLEPSDPLESRNDQSQSPGGQPQNDFQPQNDIGGDRGGNDSPNPRAGRPEKGGSQPQLSSDTKKEMEDAGFQLNENQNSRGRGNNQRTSNRDRGQQGFNSDQGSVASNRDDLEEIKSQNQQIIELLKRISDALNSGQGGQVGDTGRNRHGGRR